MARRWIAVPAHFFLPVRVLSKLFRRLMLEKLVAAHAAGKLQFFGKHAPSRRTPRPSPRFLAPLRKTKWFVYAKRPSADPRRCSPTCRATPTASPSPTAG